MKKVLLILTVTILVLSGCSQADRVSSNMSKESDNFNVVVFTTPNDAELYQASLVGRSNIMNTHHTINLPDVTSKDIYIGIITKEKQSILSKL